MMYPNIGNRYLSIDESIGEYRFAVEDGVPGAEEELERVTAAREEMVKRASAPELREIARAKKGHIAVVRTLGYEDVLEYFQVLQQGLLNGMSWSQVHVEHRSRREPLRARRRGA